jgi:broad specificity phosphatase PhoE
MSSKSHSPRKPKGIALFLVRHGHSVTNENEEKHKEIANPAVPLTAMGHEQADLMGRFMVNHLLEKFRGQEVHLWISPFKRTRQTAHHLMDSLRLAGISFRHTERPGLVELLHGDFDALNEQERRERYAFHISEKDKWQKFGARFFFRHPNGESLANLETRVEPVLDAIHREHAEHGTRIHIVIGHGWTNRVITRRWMGYSIPWVEKVPNPANTSVRCLDGMQDLGYIFGGFRNGSLDFEPPSHDPEVEEPYNYNGSPWPTRDEAAA